MVVAVYPGTFDPITNGHTDIIIRAAQLFDKVIVAVAESARKTPILSIDDRLELTKKVLGSCDGVEVRPLSGLLVDFAEQHDAGVIIRGLRAVSDFDYEFQLSGMNYQLNPNIQTVMLPSLPKYAYISSTMVREIIGLGGDITAFVDPVVFRYFK